MPTALESARTRPTLCEHKHTNAHTHTHIHAHTHTYTHRADDSEWRKEFFHSEYTKTNSEVHPPRSMTDEAKEHAFYKWMARQQLYC